MKKEEILNLFKSVGLENEIENIFENIYIGPKGCLDYFLINHFEEIRLGLIEKECIDLLEKQKRFLIKNKQTLIMKLYQIKITTNKFILNQIKTTLDYYSNRLISSAANKLYNNYQKYNDSLLELIAKDEELQVIKPKNKILKRKVVNQ